MSSYFIENLHVGTLSASFTSTVLKAMARMGEATVFVPSRA